MTLEQRLQDAVKEVADFPRPGVSFKDITPVLLEPELCADLLDSWAAQARQWDVNCVAGIEARGFPLGMALAQKLDLPFIPIRKAGKLPREVLETSYQLEYGEASLAVHREDIPAPGRILLHDDLLATGGTAQAARELIKRGGAEVVGFIFALELDFLNGSQLLEPGPIHSSLHYS